MKKSSYLIGPVLLIMVLLAGCRKLLDRLFPSHPGNTSSCVIESIGVAATNMMGYDFTQWATIQYNGAGDPVSIDLDPESSTVPSHYFYYDAAGRLSAYRIVSQDPVPLVDHRYGYDTYGRIVADTTVQTYAEPAVMVSFLSYDNEGRIYEEVRYELDTLTGSMTDMEPVYYVYDTRGNLVVGPQQEINNYYDQSANILRTNKIWMFLSRNYSRNNLEGKIEYDDEGRAVAFVDDYINQRFLPYMYIKELTYRCD